MSARLDEIGTFSLEAAFAYPVFFLFLFVLIQFSWIGFQTACIDHGVYAMGWTLDATRAESAADLDTLISSAIQADWAPLDPNRLTVRNARAIHTQHRATATTHSEADHRIFQIERATTEQRFMRVIADVDYRIASLISMPGFSDITITRHVDKTQLIDARFEVS
ncbi:MAG: hypothetical protein RR723_01420 [Raoultibacter sp.]